jgi:hypothetical protein
MKRPLKPSSVLIVVYLDIVRILTDLRMNRLLDQLSPAARNLQNKIVKRRPSQNIHMIRYTTRQSHISQKEKVR